MFLHFFLSNQTSQISMISSTVKDNAQKRFCAIKKFLWLWIHWNKTKALWLCSNRKTFIRQINKKIIFFSLLYPLKAGGCHQRSVCQKQNAFPSIAQTLSLFDTCVTILRKVLKWLLHLGPFPRTHLSKVKTPLILFLLVS